MYIKSTRNILILGEDSSIFTNEDEMYCKCGQQKACIVVSVHGSKSSFEFTRPASGLCGEFILDGGNIIGGE